MSKSKEVNDSKELGCPGCQVIYDEEGTICPVCNKKGALATKQHDDLIEGLSSALVLSKEDRLPSILEPENRPFFTKIVNQLGPRSFANLTMTCKAMHELCLNSSDIKIDYDIPWIFVSSYPDSIRFRMKEVDDVEEEDFDQFRPVNYAGKKFGFLGSAENRKILQKYPFAFRLKHLYIRDSLGSKPLSEMRRLLSEFRVDSISGIHAESIADWPGFAQFVEDFHVKEVHIRFGSSTDFCFGAMFSRFLNPLDFAPQAIPEAVATFFLQKMDHFHCNLPIAEKLLLDASVKTVRLRKTEIHQETFVELLKKFANSTEEVHWRLGRDVGFDFGHYGIFKAVSYGEGPLPEERPLAFDTHDEEVFKILRKDGKYLSVYCDGGDVVFSTAFGFHSDLDYDEYDTDDEVAGEFEGVYEYDEADDFDESADDFDEFGNDFDDESDDY